jgi:hypothetical protein
LVGADVIGPRTGVAVDVVRNRGEDSSRTDTGTARDEMPPAQVPLRRSMTEPAATELTVCWIVFHGALIVPGAASSPVGDTY